MNQRFEDAFLKALAKKIEFETSNLVSGMGIDTLELYRERVGLLRGLNHIKQLWDDTMTQLNTEKP